MITTRICDVEIGNFFLLNNQYYLCTKIGYLNMGTADVEELYADIHCKEVKPIEVLEYFANKDKTNN